MCVFKYVNNPFVYHEQSLMWNSSVLIQKLKCTNWNEWIEVCKLKYGIWNQVLSGGHDIVEAWFLKKCNKVWPAAISKPLEVQRSYIPL